MDACDREGISGGPLPDGQEPHGDARGGCDGDDNASNQGQPDTPGDWSGSGLGRGDRELGAVRGVEGDSLECGIVCCIEVLWLVP